MWSSVLSCSPQASGVSVEFVAIDGNIGSGKSTLMAALRDKYQHDKTIIFVDEPVSDWDSVVDDKGTTMLALFYSDANKYAFEFQMMAFISRLARIKQAYENINNIQSPASKYIIISERSLLTDRHIFAKMLRDRGDISLTQFTIYNKWFDEFAGQYPVSKLISIGVDSQTCSSRIACRNRIGESVSLDYLRDCQKYHDAMYAHLSASTDIIQLNLTNEPCIDGKIIAARAFWIGDVGETHKFESPNIDVTLDNEVELEKQIIRNHTDRMVDKVDAFLFPTGPSTLPQKMTANIPPCVMIATVAIVIATIMTLSMQTML